MFTRSIIDFLSVQLYRYTVDAGSDARGSENSNPSFFHIRLKGLCAKNDISEKSPDLRWLK